ncbi:MAG: hypothetical protein HRT89_23860 [Lentisphaeria bacterium]|nr:hypothetical protein [Lentisphaeria bacterium]
MKKKSQKLTTYVSVLTIVLIIYGLYWGYMVNVTNPGNRLRFKIERSKKKAKEYGEYIILYSPINQFCIPMLKTNCTIETDGNILFGFSDKKEGYKSTVNYDISVPVKIQYTRHKSPVKFKLIHLGNDQFKLICGTCEGYK